MPQSSRQRLLEAAIAIIDESGEAGLHVREAAASAGLSVAMVRHYFTDREGLVTAARAEQYRRSMYVSMPELTRILADAKSVEDLKATVRPVFDSFLTAEFFDRRMSRASALGASYRRPDLARELELIHRETSAAIGGILLIAQERGWLLPGLNPQVACMLYYGIINSRVLIESWADEDFQAEWNELAIEAIFNMYFGPDHGK